MLKNLAAGWRGYWDSLAIGFRAHRKAAIGQIALACFQALLMPCALYAMKLLIDSVQSGDETRAYVAAAVLTGTVAAIWTGMFAFIKLVFLVLFHANRTADRALMDLMGRPPGLDHHERAEYLDEVQRIREERWLLGSAVNWTSQWLRSFMILVVGGTMLAQVHPLMLLFPALALVAMAVARRASIIEINAMEATSERERRRRHLFEVATAPESGKELRIFGSADEVARRHLETGREVVAERNRAQWRAAFAAGTEGPLMAVAMALGIGFVLFLAVRGQATAGDVVLLVGLVSMVAGQAGGLAVRTVLLVRTGRLGRRIAWLKRYAESARDPLDPAPVPERLTDGIRFDRVDFSYPESERPALRQVSLHLPAGKVVALVGENGSGKTTLVKLLSGFYPPTEGRILVDGIDLDRIAAADWRPRIGATFQDYTRFEFDARESVGVGDLGAGFEEDRVRGAMDRAGSSDLIDDLPDGLDTRLGGRWEDGADLSGGQWQKIAVGRGRMREDPLLVVFDEPTAALDPQTEHLLFERFARTVRDGRDRGTATVLVSHRFSTVSMADLIVVMEDGRVAESGSHAELMDRGGTYAELYELQSSAYR
ncbi:ABC transporter ATP-binding protein [Glycomyces xiaoerkulensis]|uniref:ABC transporter ATP-binding protein n=1 Tax=Glycomyces xiaoerkulensis TaxID=2038139 RepID=UPI000C260A27|nr:ABC transporter ATP-binding protein [Glycomyces xiaoerkulensis]